MRIINECVDHKNRFSRKIIMFNNKSKNDGRDSRVRRTHNGSCLAYEEYAPSRRCTHFDIQLWTSVLVVCVHVYALCVCVCVCVLCGRVCVHVGVNEYRLRGLYFRRLRKCDGNSGILCEFRIIFRFVMFRKMVVSDVSYFLC